MRPIVLFFVLAVLTQGLSASDYLDPALRESVETLVHDVEKAPASLENFTFACQSIVAVGERLRLVR